MTSETHPSHGPSALRGLAASVVFVVMLLAALALWTVIPVGWLYIGSKVATPSSRPGAPTPWSAIGIVVTIVLDAWLIGRLNGLYMRITGTNRLAPMRPSWLKSMRDTARRRRHDDRGRGGADGLGAARRRRLRRLVLPAGRVADAQPVSSAQTTNLPSSCITSPSTSSLPPRRRSQTRSVWTADSLSPPDSG